MITSEELTAAKSALKRAVARGEVRFADPNIKTPSRIRPTIDEIIPRMRIDGMTRAEWCLDYAQRKGRISVQDVLRVWATVGVDRVKALATLNNLTRLGGLKVIEEGKVGCKGKPSTFGPV